MTDVFESELAEARRYWDLGYYSKALICFTNAENESSSLRLATEISAFLVSQGQIKLGHDKISKALLTLRDGAEELEVVMAEVLEAMYGAFITTQFSRSLKIATNAYKQHLSGVDVENYTKLLVSMEYAYYNQKILASSLGVIVEGPKTDQDKIAKIFQHCISKGWFDKARQVARIYIGPVGPIGNLLNGHESQVNSEKLKMFEVLVENDSTPAVVRAESLLDFSGFVREINDIQRSDSLENEAKKLFRDIGHACGEDLIDLGNLRKQPSVLSPLTRRENIAAIKKRLKDHENWAGVAEAIRALYDVAMQSLDYDLIDELDQEIDTIKSIYTIPFTWFEWKLAKFYRWVAIGGNYAKISSSLKALYQSLEGTEAFRLKNEAASLIGKVFDALGDQRQASEWKAKVESAPNYFSFEDMMHDSFIDKLNLLSEDSSLSEIKAIDDELQGALERLALEAADTISISTRWIAVDKIANICEFYLGQLLYSKRDFRCVKDLVLTCSKKGRSLLGNLDDKKAASYVGRFLEIDARISTCEANFSEPALKLECIKNSAIQYGKAIDQYRRVGLQLELGYTLSAQADCYHRLWFATNILPDSEYFFLAARCCEEATPLLANCDFLASSALRANARKHLQIWISGYCAKVQLPKDPFPWSSAFHETEKCLKNLERLIQDQQHDLSILPMEQALLAKQKLRDNQDVSAIYKYGVILYEMEGKPQMFWETLQKSKARSVSDLLGLGIKIPQILQSKIDQNPAAKTLLLQESNLLEKIKENRSDSQFQLRKKLEAHQRTMRAENCLRELLNLREGAPVTSVKLRALKIIQEKHGNTRQIFFADWYVHNGKVRLMVLTPSDYPIFDLGFTKADIEGWRETHIVGKEEPLNSDNRQPLQELSKLVEPLVKLSNEGDLLVLCPSSSLHYIPIHAATISKSSNKSLIDRNPVVYCPSMTVFDQCVTRAESRTKKPDSTKQTLLAVYEKPDSENVWKQERYNAYSMCRKIAVELGNCAVFTGSEVDKSRFREACETVDTLHFIGHCERADNILDQRLIISAKSTATNTIEVSRDYNVDRMPHEMLVPADNFTISDMLATCIRTSHFDLIACASASQRVIGGDEPWGIVTALLCAGATSVSGTQWEIEAGAARKYFSIMYTDILKKENEIGAEEGIGKVVDLAVALQKTVKKLKRDVNYRQPFHWASLVLYGSWFSCY